MMILTRLTIAALVLLATVPTLCRAQQGPAEPDPGFKPALVSVDFSARTVRPGDLVGVTYRFRNDGTKPASGDHRVFVHLEYPEADCRNIVVGMDHPPSRRTSTWAPGEIIADGPYVFAAPAGKGDATYHVHVGVFAPDLADAPRLLDQYAGELKVDHTAPPQADLAPALLSADECALRRVNLSQRIKEPVSLEDPIYRFTIDKASGAWQLLDRTSGVLWSSNPDAPVFAEVELTDGKSTVTAQVRRWDEVTPGADHLTLAADLQANGQPAGRRLVVTARRRQNPVGLVLQYAAPGAGPWQVKAVRLLDEALWTTAEEQGYSVLPNRLGSLVPASGGLPRLDRFRTYANTSLALYGAVKAGSALLVAWPHPDTELEFKRSWPDNRLVAGRRMNSMSLTLRGGADSCTICPLGTGDYAEMAQAYRLLAKERGLLTTWAEKRKLYPNVDRLIGAADFKPFVFVRSVPREAGGQEHLSVGYSFEETAQLAEHWNKDLGLDRAMVVLAGWIHRGYDNQHPDILPAAPECGGDEQLAAAARRIKDCGYLFGLHDNYQDMYRDAPSWDEKYLNRDSRGVVRQGGFWAGGQAYQVCAIEQVKLAQRPQNLPAVERLFGPSIYFIDTVFAWPLVTCEAPDHPMSYADDMKYKSSLCLEAKKHFGLFGSEEGREWAVPCADYMEGILGHKVSRDGSEIVIPLLQMIYGDCTTFYTHQSDRLAAGDNGRLLSHLLYGAMPVYEFGSHLYWKSAAPQGLPLAPLPPKVERTGNDRFNITYRWQVNGKIAEDLFCFVHFTHPRSAQPEAIAYQNDHEFKVPSTQWQPGTVVEDGPHTVTIPAEAFGETEVLVGLLDKSRERVTLAGLPGRNGRYSLGTLETSPQALEFRPAPAAAAQLSYAPDEGWTKGLCATDRFIKNTYEVLSYLQRLTAERPMTRHAFLTADRSVERSTFGDGLATVTANYGPAEYKLEGVTLPAGGFLVESPSFVAFCASSYGGRTYSRPAMFTVRALDGLPLEKSAKVRVYHAFGDPKVTVRGRQFEAEREATVER